MLRQMIRKNISLQPSQVKNFVETASKCNFDVDIYYNRYVVDAKSILGVLGLDFTQNLTVEFSGHNAEFEQYLDSLAVAG
ncbi:PTS HPr component phosphorylation site [Butyrivibrio proteoclasticus]|uniref:PTS HPr component phosphorylation site n=1 Tax=Butyrivibrio proteoclasticus TaxID=43305 RepID=A0A1I5URK0_9FIRM|nr:HPr family phosphocarrier protein [Butyrivibrio proteoclasticus]SFP97849.1 PTS HPr component phosphorylation site [Butyrivibrio proteoclasticus]